MKRRIYARELFLYKIPTVIVDSILLCISLFAAANATSKDWVEVTTGSYLLLLASYLLAIRVVPIRLAERKISYGVVALRAIGQTSLTIIFYGILLRIFYFNVPLNLLLVQLPISCVALLCSHIGVRLIIRKIRKSGRNRMRILMVGGDMNLVHIYNSIMRGYGVHGYDILGFFTDKYQDQIPSGAKLLGPMDNVMEYVRNHDIDELFCSINPAADKKRVYDIIKLCNDKFIQFWFVPNMNGYPHHRMKYEEFGAINPVNIISLRNEPLANPLNRAVKRCIDIVASSLFLVTLYPFVWLFAAIGIKLSSPGPILFRQKRTGYSGVEFDCLKFRSMKVNADADKVQATQNDPRKTKFGDFMRRTSIDELPQFINVFKGDMSLVGPRPHMDFHTELYSKLISDYMVRHLVKPGITGWAQVNGCRGETKTVDQMKERVEHDIYYIENWSVFLDIKIIYMTIAQIFSGDKQAY